MVKSVEDKVKEVVDGPKKMTDVVINFKNGEVLVCEDTDGHQVGQFWVAVIAGKQTFLYKSEDIQAIKVTVKE